MNTVSYPLIVMASAILIVGSNHLFLYLHRKDRREDVPAMSSDESLSLADDRLLAAKDRGRNNIVYE
jgi:hypothetical protein